MDIEQKRNFFKQSTANFPIQRLGKVEEIAAAVLFLVTNDFVTGLVCDVDGGARL